MRIIIQTEKQNEVTVSDYLVKDMMMIDADTIAILISEHNRKHNAYHPFPES